MMREDRSGSPAALPFLAVGVVVLAGFVWIGLYHWRLGSALIAGGLLLAAVLRGLLGTERAGMLALRSRPVDVALYGGLGVVMLLVDLTITGGPFG